jgi:hypothetical protein
MFYIYVFYMVLLQVKEVSLRLDYVLVQKQLGSLKDFHSIFRILKSWNKFF